MSPITLVKNNADTDNFEFEIERAFTLDQLKMLHQNLIGGKAPSKKMEVSEELANFLCSPSLKTVFEKLDKLEKLAVAEAFHSANGYVPERFAANYGKVPSLRNSSGYKSCPQLLNLFLRLRVGTGFKIREALQDWLVDLVEKPKSPSIGTVETLPEFLEYKTKRYEWAKNDPGQTVFTRKNIYRLPTEQPTVHIETELIKIESTTNRAEDAQRELWLVIKAIQDGKIAVSDKTEQPTPDSMWKLSQALGGDFFQTKDGDEYKTIGLIRSYAWPILLQSSAFAQRQGKKLVASKLALTAKSQEPHELIKSIWKSWLKNSNRDEFRRIDSIKGQSGRARSAMADPTERRNAIVETLSACPSNKWIKFEEFSRYMRACGNSFDVCYDPWLLYINDTEYGALGFDGSYDWEILQDRYILCFLFEYAATLGLIDIAFVDPVWGRNDFRHMWGTDELPFLSRYDGLLYFKINDLGDYCLDKTKSLVARNSKGKAKLSVMPSMRIRLTNGQLSIAETLLLDSFCESIEDGIWQLSKEKSMLACESGQDMSAIRNLLERLDEQILPDTVDKFIDQIDKRSKALERIGSMTMFYCSDSKIAKEIVSHALTKNLCMAAGSNHLVVKTSFEEKFRRELRILGYGLSAVIK